MTCRQAQALLEDFVDQELNGSDSQQLKDHIEICETCREEYESSARLKELLSNGAGRDPGDDYFTEVHSLIMARTVEESSYAGGYPAIADHDASVRSPFVRSLLMAAASICLFFISLLIGSHRELVFSEAPDSYDQQGTITLLSMAQSESDTPMTNAEIRRVSRGVLLLGPPGMLGRVDGITGALDLE